VSKLLCGTSTFLVAIAGVLPFASDEAWVLAMEVMSAIDLEIIGGCC
jgi:hypothetical protein